MKKLRLCIFLLICILLAGCTTPKGDFKTPYDSPATQPTTQPVTSKPTPELPPETYLQEPSPDKWNSKFPAKGVPVLYYHSIANLPGNELGLPPEKFAEQMKYLHDAGYTPITLDQLDQALIKHAPLPPKPVAITMDDGYADNYSAAFPILKQYKFTAAIFVMTGGIGTGMLSWEQLKEMNAYGISIMPHTVNHLDLSKLSKTEQQQEIANAKVALESTLGTQAVFFCYPFGKYTSTTNALLKELGFTLAFTTTPGKVKLGDDPYHLKRIYVNGFADLETFKHKLNS